MINVKSKHAFIHCRLVINIQVHGKANKPANLHESIIKLVTESTRRNAPKSNESTSKIGQFGNQWLIFIHVDCKLESKTWIKLNKRILSIYHVGN